jgi:hypothetical protein
MKEETTGKMSSQIRTEGKAHVPTVQTNKVNGQGPSNSNSLSLN